ncbi:MAG: hypothetical protein AB1782_13760 [Cyanobacteriota bacterium]
MSRNKIGNSFIQYAIIIILVALSVVAIYFLLGENIKDNLSFFSSSMGKSAKAVSFTGIDGTVKSFQPGDLSGTPDNPVSECNNNTCILDYGDYILDGIPANFSDESTSSRGTDQLTQVMGSMLNQLEAENDPPDDNLTELIELIKQAIQKSNMIADAEQVLEVAALDVYLGQDNQLVNETVVFQQIIQSLGQNPQYKILQETGLIVIPPPGEELSPDTPLFRDTAWLNDPAYSNAIINTTKIGPTTDTLQTLKTEILTAADDCGKTEQGKTVAYLIDIITQVSLETQSAASNGADILGIKSIVDNKDIVLTQELINIAKGIDPSLGNSPPY